jgi:hypothetical protein
MIRTKPDSTPKTQILQDKPEMRTESGTPSGENAPPDPDLALLVERWPKLHPAVKEQIMATIRGTVDKERAL